MLRPSETRPHWTYGNACEEDTSKLLVLVRCEMPVASELGQQRAHVLPAEPAGESRLRGGLERDGGETRRSAKSAVDGRVLCLRHH
jgi:hypothetical protein